MLIALVLNALCFNLKCDFRMIREKIKTELGFALSNFLMMLAGLLLFVAVVFYTFGYVVPPGMMGVRQITMKLPFGPDQGFATKALAPGYHWSIPFYSYTYKIPQTIQTFHFSRVPSEQESGASSLEIQTSDGSSVLVDVSVLYRFYSESGTGYGGPADLFTKTGTNSFDWIDRIRTAAENELKDALGKLSTSDFYNPHSREKQLLIALKEITARLKPLGIQIEDVLLRRYTYSEERIDQAIFEKNLQNQEERLNAASSRLADARANLEAVSAEWDAKIETLKVDGTNQASVLRSEAALYEAKKSAEADLLVAKSRAESDRLKAQALSENPAAKIYVARKMAPMLKSLKGGVITGVDPFNVNAWTKKLGVNGGQNEK